MDGFCLGPLEFVRAYVFTKLLICDIFLNDSCIGEIPLKDLFDDAEIDRIVQPVHVLLRG